MRDESSFRPMSVLRGLPIGVISFRLVEDEFGRILEEDFSRILFISLGIGLIILLLAFRAVVVAVIPLAMAIGAIFSSIGVAALVSRADPLVELYAEMILLMGLAVGIDYSLFIVSRFRSERRSGRPKLEAISVESNTTGRAVFYAGVTVRELNWYLPSWLNWLPRVGPALEDAAQEPARP